MNELEILNNLKIEDLKRFEKEYTDIIAKVANDPQRTLIFLVWAATTTDPAHQLKVSFISGAILGMAFQNKLTEIKQLETLYKEKT